MRKILFIFLLCSCFMNAQTYVGFNVGNTDFEPNNVSFSGAVTYQPTVFGLKAQYFNSQQDGSFQLQTTIEPFRGDIWTPVVSAGYNFQNRTTQPMVGLQNQMQIVPNVYITAGYEAIFEYRSPVMQYIYFGTVMKVVEPDTKPKRFY